MTWQVILKKYEPYLVNKKVWKEANLSYNAGALSIEELEEKLGRKLKPNDFSNAPITFKGIINKPTVLDRVGKEEIYKMYKEWATHLFGYGAGSGTTLEELNQWKSNDMKYIKKDLEFLGYDSKPILDLYEKKLNKLQERLQWVGKI